MSNIFNHQEDAASDVTFDDSTTIFNGITNNLQTALGLFKPHTISDYPHPDYATEDIAGIAYVVSDANSSDTINDHDIFTPKKLYYVKATRSPATTSVLGFVINASATDIAAGTNTEKYVSPNDLNYWKSTLGATESDLGILRIATRAEVDAYTTDSAYMTPKKTNRAINEFAYKRPDATTTTAGGIRLSTETDVASLTPNSAYTPSSLNYRTGSTSVRGLYYVYDGSVNSNNYAITPGNMSLIPGSATQAGFIQLNNTLTSTSVTTALTAAQGYYLQNNTLSKTGGTVTSLQLLNMYSFYTKLVKKSIAGGYYYIRQTTSTKSVDENGKLNANSGLNGRPIGSYYMSIVSTNPEIIFGGRWVQVSGRTIVGAGSSTDAAGKARTFTSGQTSGAYGVTITESTMPTHKHSGWGESGKNAGIGFGTDVAAGKGKVGSNETDRDNYHYYTSAVGGGQAHNNMQPYTTVYIWRRIA